MKFRRKFAATALLAFLALSPVTALALPAPAAQDTPAKERFRSLQQKFVCQCGCNYNLLHCPHLVCPSAPVMRKAILAGIGAGDSDEQIVASMVGQFGEVALAQPTMEGFNIVGWVMPFVALLTGLVLLYGIAKAWRKRAPQTASAASPELLEKYRGAIEQEMKELED